MKRDKLLHFWSYIQPIGVSVQRFFFYYIHLTECMFTTKKNKSIFVSNSRQSKAYKTLKIVDF